MAYVYGNNYRSPPMPSDRLTPEINRPRMIPPPSDPAALIDAATPEQLERCVAMVKGEWTPGSSEDWKRLQTPYSTDIAAAWEVVEHLRKPPREWGFKIMGDRNFPALCTVAGGVPMAHVEGDSVPHAICLAALKAVGVLGND